MAVYMYVVARDFGFAPNPFHGVCTLATCKPVVRRMAKEGDWVVGMGGGKQKALEELVAAEKTVWGEIQPAAAFLIDRDSPIDRREDLTYWQQLRDSYVQLGYQQSSEHPVHTVRNIGSIAEAVDSVATKIAEALVK